MIKSDNRGGTSSISVNHWWENLVMGILFCLAVYYAIASIKSVFEAGW